MYAKSESITIRVEEFTKVTWMLTCRCWNDSYLLGIVMWLNAASYGRVYAVIHINHLGTEYQAWKCQHPALSVATALNVLT